MRRKILLIFIFTLISSASLTFPVFSATISSSPSISPSPSPSSVIDELKKIQILKEKIATKVSEIRSKEKTALAGKVKKIDQAKIFIETRNGEQTITFSEDTLVYDMTGGEKKEADIKKIKEGDFLSVFGYYNEDKSILASKYLYLQNILLHLLGTITDINKENYTITVKGTFGTQVADIETYTKMSSYTKERGLVKTGFSKLKVGTLIHVMGKENAKEENRMTALRALVLTFGLQLSGTPSATPTKE